MLSRDTQTKIYGILYPIGFIGLAIGVSIGSLAGESKNFDSVTNNVVTSSEFNGAKSQFEPDPDTFFTEQNFLQCRLNRASNIGLIYDQDKFGQDSTDALLQIYTKINDAYSQIPGAEDIGLGYMTFESQDQADTYIASKGYSSAALCFTLSWDQYSNTADAPDFSLNINNNLYQSGMQNPNDDQDRYYQYKFDEASLTAFNDTDYLQVMGIATSVVLGKYNEINDPTGDSVDFSVMYTPMNTGNYDYYGKDGVSLVFCLVYEMISIVIAMFYSNLSEPTEEMIEMIMKRLGVQRSVMIMRDLTFSLAFSMFWSIVATIAFYFASYSDTLGLGVFLLFVFLNQIQVVLRQVVLGVVVPKKWNILVSSVLFIFQIALITVLVTDVPVQSLTIMGCIVSPMIQLMSVFHMAFAKFSFNEKLDFANFSEQVYPNISLMLIFILAMSMTAFFALTIVYLWPYKIEADPENPLNWYYPFTCKYWCGSKNTGSQNVPDHYQSIGADEENSLLVPLQGSSDSKLAEKANLQQAEKILVTKGILEVPALSSEQSLGKLVITDLGKKYGSKQVVKDLSLTIYQGEILVLLGHNGAGKTTTLNMLTGLVKPTSGGAIAHNIGTSEIDLFTDYQNIADFIGLCPQVDVLFTKMTVRENLIFYCKLKSVDNMDQVIDQTLNKFNLTDRQDAFANDISGGQKRKLQLAIALLGDSKIVLLDEPTSGMDPTARRETWEIIRQAKQDKIIILTTHYMDEAEYLADRVAVVSRGELKICGTTAFLKTQFGHYFYVEVDPVNKDQPENEALMQLFESHNAEFGHAQSQDRIEEEKSGEHTIKPQDFVSVTSRIDESGKTVYKLANYISARFREIFDEIDADLGKFGIKNYKIKNMTLEQVFIAIGEQEIEKDRKENQESHEDLNQSSAGLIDLPQCEVPGPFNKFMAMFVSLFQSQWNGGVQIQLVAFFVVMTGCNLFIYLPTILRSSDTLDYDNVNSLFLGETLNLQYNENYANGQENAIVNSILSSQSTLKGQAQDWQKSEDENYTTFFTSLAKDQGDGTDSNKGSYWVDATSTQNADNSYNWNINAVVYATASSPASVPTFGSLLLQSIAQNVTGNKKFSLSFKYQAYDQTVAMAVQSDAQLGSTVISLGGMLLFGIELKLMIQVLIMYFGNYYRSILMRGATSSSFVLAKLVLDFIVWYIFFQILVVSNIMFGIDTSGWQVFGILFAVSCALYNAMFNALMFDKPGFMILRIILLVLQMLFIWFSGNFLPNYIEDADGQNLANLICRIGCFSPGVQLLYALFMCQYRYVVFTLQNANAENFTIDKSLDVSPYGEYAAGVQFQNLIGQIGVYGVLLILVLLFVKASVKAEPGEIEPEEDDYAQPKTVTDEAERVAKLINEDGGDSEVLIVNNLVKRYYTKPTADSENNAQNDRHNSEIEEADPSAPVAPVIPGFNAVKGTSFGVKRGEVFSLLGVNGAGKSTTFGCLVGQQRVSGGTVLIDGENVANYVGQPQKLHGLIGFCPQTNTFDPSLTVKQQVMLIAKLIGIPQDTLDAYVNSTMTRFGLSMFTDTNAGSLSGGNMRKLSLAMAMLGRPKVICIDEASTGVDPGSRRTMWRAIRHEGADSAVVLTTHAMEEAEAISTKIAIQVQGWFRSYGTLAEVQGEGDLSCYYVDIDIDLNAIAQGALQDEQLSTLVHEQDAVIQQLQIWQRDLQQSDKNLNYVDELKPLGLLDKFDKLLKAGEPVDLKTILHELLMQDKMVEIMNAFSAAGMSPRVLNYDGEKVTLLVNNSSMSFGQIYAFMQGLKFRHSIREYSCKRSSLEEVFNGHATESMFADLNKRLERRRTSYASCASIQK